MSLIYITGISGSGKSAVLKELKNRGYEAYGTDEDGISAFFDNATNEILDNPPNQSEQRTPEWRSQYTWKMRKELVEDLSKKANNKDIYIIGVAANEGEVWDYFDVVMALVIDEETLKKRLAQRTDNNFGKADHELQQILDWQRNTNDAYKKFGHITIDATQPIGDVADEVINKAQKAIQEARQTD